MKTLLHALNEAQYQAVTAPLGHQLILAGAGSGKTRVLVHRIAWLIEKEQLLPSSILAVTFTNKAATEIRERIRQLLDIPTHLMWIGTFHGLAHRFLRKHWHEANLPETFHILDSDDQLRLVRRVMKSMEVDETFLQPKQAQWFINAKKDEGLRPNDISSYGDRKTDTLIRIYQSYEESCERSGLIDFADLLMKSHQVLMNSPHVLAEYQQLFRYLLVDEFQDSNTIQYAWLRLLAGQKASLMIVGDDDQSIYGWRGAKIENIHRFCKDYSNVMTVRLEQNYRSTGTILKASNALISKNQARLGKNLWTTEQDGELITVYAGFNDLDEARFLVAQIREWQQKGNPLNDVAILYRSNAQSRVIEEALMQFTIPYRVYGGLRFFERAEIKDALAYLRLMVNRADDAAFERILNTPTRGLGDRTLQILRDHAKENQITLWESATILLREQFFPARATNALSQFLHLIETLNNDTELFLLPEKIEHTIHHTGLIEHYSKEKGEKGVSRIENLEELVQAARQFPTENNTLSTSSLSDFLAHSSLESGERQDEDHGSNVVQLMTLHSAKGLEFPVVFLCGFEEGLFPHYMTMNNPEGLEEERRLCYVGMTRAKKRLFITYAEVRQLHGKKTAHHPSRFLMDIPSSCLNYTKMSTQISRPEKYHSFSKKENTNIPQGLQIGQRIKHIQFGHGIILQYEGHHEHARIQVRFEEVGTKWLMASFVSAT